MGTDSDGPGSESVRGGKLTGYGGGTMTVGSVKIGTDETVDPNPDEQYPQYGETYGSGTLNVQGSGTVFRSAGDVDMQGPWTLLCVTNGARFAASNFTMHCGWARAGGVDVGIARFSGSGTFVSLKTFAMGRNGFATVNVELPSGWTRKPFENTFNYAEYKASGFKLKHLGEVPLELETKPE